MTLTKEEIQQLKALKAKGYDMDSAFAELSKGKSYKAPSSLSPSEIQAMGKNKLNGLTLSPITEGAGQVVTGAGKQLVKDSKSLFNILSTGVNPNLGLATKAITDKYLPNKKLEPTNNLEQIGATGAQVAEFFIPGGATSKATKAIGESKFIAGLPSKLKGLAKLGGAASTEAASMGGVSAVQEGGLNKNVLVNAAMGASIPVVGGAAKKLSAPVTNLISEKLPSSIMNSLIKPAKNEYKFAKNPGLAISKEGISANTMSGLLKKVASKKSEVGKMLGDKITDSGSKVNAQKIIDSIASNYTKTISDPAAATKFKGIMDQIFKKTKYKDGELITTGVRDLKSMTPKELHNLQNQIGDLIPWVKEAYDKDINQTLSKMYSAIGKKLNSVAPGTKALQTRYANLLAAEKTVANRIDRLSSSNLLMNLVPTIGFGAGYASGGDSVDGILKGLLLSGALKGGRSTAVQSNISRLLSSTKNIGQISPSSITKLLASIKASKEE